MIKQKTLLIILGVIIFLLGGVTYYTSSQLEKLPKLNQYFLQEKIDNIIITNGEGKKGKIDYKLRSADIFISDVVDLSFSLDLKGYGFTGDIIANVTGTPVYNKEKKAFYFKPSEQVEFKRLQIDGNFKPTGLLGKIANKSSFVQSVLSDNQIIKDLTAKAITIYLNKLPIYKLPKEKLSSKVIGIALNKVEVSNGEILISVSFWQITKTVAIFLLALILAIGMTAALVLHPEMFGTFIALSVISG